MTRWINFFFVYCVLGIAHLHSGLFNLINSPAVQEYLFTQPNTQNPAEQDNFSTQPETESRFPRLAIVMIFQDDAPYLKEWVEYHKLLGVQRFYLYNNESIDDYQKVLKPYVKKGDVELIQWDKTGYDGHDLPSWNAVQCLAYMNALARARSDGVTWLAILDSDEFLVPRQTDSLTEFLAQYENDTIGSLHVNWVMFGTSYVEMIPSDKLLIETLLLNQGYVEVGSKTIVRPDRCDPNIMGGPHAQPMLPNYVSVSIPFELMQCNHYWTRDVYYLNKVKIPRRIRWGTPPDACLEWANSFNEQTSAGEPILRFVPQLRKKMGLD